MAHALFASRIRFTTLLVLAKSGGLTEDELYKKRGFSERFTPHHQLKVFLQYEFCKKQTGPNEIYIVGDDQRRRIISIIKQMLGLVEQVAETSIFNTEYPTLAPVYVLCASKNEYEVFIHLVRNFRTFRLEELEPIVSGRLRHKGLKRLMDAKLISEYQGGYRLARVCALLKARQPLIDAITHLSEGLH